ncbi:helix-turn-helix transcriptional regulator [Collinsella aerofaciens]|uniref:Helix-turn-helix n=1 Tax=Collinsella aerofaciens TaxID=74426 RepID=A0A5K1IK36_9ACTN|nr:helix-turn-helix transcriptional regulator [Collinsella aerofaciens]VWL87190.1 Helix-turn-helix [Collinsella aerofaciens]
MPGKKNLRMKAARAGAGLSQADLAQAVGVTRQTIGLIEAGGYNPTLNLCVAICKALRVTLNDLFWDDEIKADPNAL